LPHLLWYESGLNLTTRSIRELRSLHRHGWDITIAHEPGVAEAVAALGFGSCLLPASAGNPFNERLVAESQELNARLDTIRHRIDTIAETGESFPWRLRLGELKDEVDSLVAEIAVRRGAGDRAAEAAARVRLAAVKDERTAVAEQIRSAQADLSSERAALRRERDEIVSRMRAVMVARRLRTPLTNGVTFGDLARLEPNWHAHAPVLATVAADVFWAADLDGLPPVIWASEAAPHRPPVVYDSQELFAELEYLPELYRAAWRQIALEFIPRAALVITVCDPIARVLDGEYGANSTSVIPNYASTAAAGPAGLRHQLRLDASTPLAIHIGNVSEPRNPGFVVDVLADVPGLEVAFVGAARHQVVANVRSAADSRGVGDRLHFVPAVPLDDVTGFIADADLSLILLDGSRSRDTLFTMPNKMYDSLTAGVPVIAAEGSSAGDFLVAEGLGRVFKLDVAGDLTRAVRSVLADAPLRDRVRARATEFIWSRVEPTLLGLVDGLVAASSTGLPGDYGSELGRGAGCGH
jgi:glycosyltransferase involved in cell wall biosynthesis